MDDPIKLVFRPGINRETTDYANSGGYTDGNLVRFVKGFPQSMGGWRKFTSEPTRGIPRGLFPFTLLNGDHLYGMGTTAKYYIIQGTSLIDVTPLRDTEALAADPFTTLNASTHVTVHDVAHGAMVGDYVSFSGAADVGGVLAATLNAEFEIFAITDVDNYVIIVDAAATSGATGGGAAVVAEYQIHIGLDATAYGLGWGTGAWGEGGWGEASSSPTEIDRMRLWTQDNFGQDLLACLRNGPIYVKDNSLPLSIRMTALVDAVGANYVPEIARQITVSDVDRHVIAFGCNGLVDIEQDRLLIRWSDTEDDTEWEITTTTSAGSLRIETGSEIVCAIETGSEIAVFTDISLHSMKYIGAPYTFGQVKVADNVHIIGPNAAVADNAIVYFMATGKFQTYNGVVSDIDCDIQTYIYGRLNFEQREKIRAGLNTGFGEVIWLIPVDGATENNFYVIHNYIDLTWAYGSFGAVDRSTWIDAYFEQHPMATGDDGYVYLHDIGNTDGTVTPAIELPSFVEAAPLEIGAGNQFMYCDRLIPDVDFSGSDVAIAPQANITLTMVDAPGLAARATARSLTTQAVVQTASVPVSVFTEKKDFQIRGRSLKYRIASGTLGTHWRQGMHRLYAQPDGEQ